ncbi:MAG TPA: hypothetical protein DCO86_03990 [Spirochaetaceae bacterium]|nr:hypothetical protein [Spirochaetaceae bacterium]
MVSNSVFESKEMYLESILLLLKSNSAPHAKDLAEYMNFSRPSVSRALSSLESAGLVFRDGDDVISLTREGRMIAESVYEKHLVITDFLVLIGVDRQVAERDACKFEHVISEETFSRIKDFVGNSLGNV